MQTIPIYDISYPVPDTQLPESKDLKWLGLMSDYSQLLSRIYEELFSVKARRRPKESIQMTSDKLLEELESWKLSVPDLLRPGSSIRIHKLGNLVMTSLAVQLHFFYYNIHIAILRAALQTCPPNSEKYFTYEQALVDSAKGITDLVHLVPLEPFVSTW